MRAFGVMFDKTRGRVRGVERSRDVVRALAGLSLMVVFAQNGFPVSPRDVDCSEFPQNTETACCITFWRGDKSCSMDNPDVDANGATSDGHNLSACLESQCEPHCSQYGGTYLDGHGVQRPLMRWSRAALSCICQIVDEHDPSTDPTMPSACRVPVDEGLVINEYRAVVIQRRSAYPNFVELYNASGGTVDLGRYKLASWIARGYGYPTNPVLPLPHVSLSPGDHMVICDSTSPVINCDFGGLETLGISDIVEVGSRSLQLLRQFHVADAATFAGPISPWPHGEGSGTVPALRSEGYSGRSRFPDGIDTDDTLSDTAVRCVTPGRPNTDREEPCQEPQNQPPQAHAVATSPIECTSPEGAEAVLDGSASTDADSTNGTNDDIVRFTWREGETTVATGEVASAVFALGSHLIELTVMDRSGAQGTDTVGFVVQDTTPPTIACPADVASECQSAGQAPVSLPLANASDPCDGTVAITNDRTQGGADASGSYPLGTTTVIFTATDRSGNTATCTTVVTVADTMAPLVTVDATPNYLWPPNHTMRRVHNGVRVFDACDRSPALRLHSVTSNEPDDAPGGGDGSTINDVQDATIGTRDLDIQLRAERLGSGTGRTYSIRYEATDASGNMGAGTATVSVPRN